MKNDNLSKIQPRQLRHLWQLNPELHGEQTIGKSLTVPDESFTIKELIEKFTVGLNPPVNLQGQEPIEEDPAWDNEDLEKIARLDIIEQTEYMQAAHDFIKAKNDMLDEMKALQAQADYEELIELRKAKKTYQDQLQNTGKIGTQHDQKIEPKTA